MNKTGVKFYFWIQLPHFSLETFHFSHHQGRCIHAHTNTILSVLSISVYTFISDTKHLLVSCSLTKSVTEEEVVCNGDIIDISYADNELSMTTNVSRLINLKREGSC
jgi:hypothetical protein